MSAKRAEPRVPAQVHDPSLVPDLLSDTKENPVTCGRERIELLPPINRADSTQMVQFFSGGDCKSPPSSDCKSPPSSGRYIEFIWDLTLSSRNSPKSLAIISYTWSSKSTPIT